MTAEREVRECFQSARHANLAGRKHKGLFLVKKDPRKAEDYIRKTRLNLELCYLYKEKRLDYKIPEEWFYTMYYCALAILARLGVESRSQRCTALFLRYPKDKGVVALDDDFIERITVHAKKEVRSAVDEREEARYGSSVRSEEVMNRYEGMMQFCRECISRAEEIVFSEASFDMPREALFRQAR